MQYYTTEPELLSVSNQGNEMWVSCSYPEKNAPSFMMHMWKTFEYLKMCDEEHCEIMYRFWELIYEKEEWVRHSIQKIIPDWKRDY